MTTITIQEDLADEFVWTTIETTRDDNGVILGRETVFDNGVYRADAYEFGVLRIQQQTDGEQDAKPWQSLETYFDENGVVIARFEIRDNDVSITTAYEDGVRASKVWTDDPMMDAKNWQQIEEYYDQNGDRSARIELRDDGVSIVTQYEAGVRRAVTSTDLQEDGTPSDARSWERIETYYDAQGERTARFEKRDNGITVTNEYEAGTLRIQTQTDGGDGGMPTNAASWETNTAYFGTTGQLEAREIVYDNADVTATFFEDGLRALRLQYDGDNSASWLVRETIYDEAAQVLEINTYDTAEDVPPEYGFLVLA